jgi:hypothetical protein
LLEPLTHVALVSLGPLGEFARCRIALVRQRAIKTKPAADVDGSDLKRVDRRREQALHQRVRFARRRLCITHNGVFGAHHCRA